MYDELVKRLRVCPNYTEACVSCPHEHDLGCRTTTMHEAADAIEKLSKPKWIPVTERLPEEFQSVWAACKSMIDSRPNWTIETVYDPHLTCPWGHIPMLEDGKAVVYAWMDRPLPEPPKEGT